MMQGVRYRERGPMKSWRPETMAEAIWAVLQEGTMNTDTWVYKNSKHEFCVFGSKHAL